MNRDEAKFILLLYRHGTVDQDDPQISEALALAERDRELKDWLVIHCARQFVIGEKFQRITAPAGLKEQILSEQVGKKKIIPLWRREIKLTTLAAVILLSGLVAAFWFADHRESEDTLAVFQNQMAGIALRGYAMDLATNDFRQIRAYLALNHAPADFILPETLKHAVLTGCAIEGWQNVKVSMICFRSSRAGAAVQSDLWLFVVDQNAVRQSADQSKFLKVNRLATATWTQHGKLYFLGTTDDAETLQHYL